MGTACGLRSSCTSASGYYVTQAQQDALAAAHSPSGANPYLTEDALGLYAVPMILDADVVATSTEIEIRILHGDVIADLGWVVIDPYTDECEIRAVTNVAAATKELTVAALDYAHNQGDLVLWVNTPTANVKWFDAKGDGSTDDTTAFTRAVAQIELLGGGVLSIPQGNYIIDGTTGIVLCDYITVIGAGVTSTIIQLSDSGGATHRAFKADGKTEIVIRDLRVDDFAGAGGTGLGFQIGNTSRVLIENVYVTGFSSSSVHIGGGTMGFPCSYVTINDSTFYNNWSGVGITHAQIVTLNNCKFMNSTAATAGLNAEPNAGEIVSDVRLFNCVSNNNAGRGFLLHAGLGAVEEFTLVACSAESNGSHGIQVQDADRVVIQGCRAISNTLDGIAIGTGTNITVAGCISEGNTSDGISVGATAVNLTITGCTCYDNTETGIRSSAEGAVIQGNECADNGDSGIYVRECDYVSVVGNVAYGNTVSGFELLGIQYSSVTGNVSHSNTENGILLRDTGGIDPFAVTVSDNSVFKNTLEGIYFFNVSFCKADNNQAIENGDNGIYVYVGDDCSVCGNSCVKNSDGGAGDAGIRIRVSDRCNVQGNTCRAQVGGVGTQSHGIWISSASCDDTLVTNNDCKGGGTANDILDAGTNTVTAAGNRT